MSFDLDTLVVTLSGTPIEASPLYGMIARQRDTTPKTQEATQLGVTNTDTEVVISLDPDDNGGSLPSFLGTNGDQLPLRIVPATGDFAGFTLLLNRVRRFDGSVQLVAEACLKSNATLDALEVGLIQNGVLHPDSPFPVVFTASTGYFPHSQIIPAHLNSQTLRQAIFSTPLPPVAVGNILTLPAGAYTAYPAGTFAKIINIVDNPGSIACDLQIVPFVAMSWWTAAALSASVPVNSFNLSDEAVAPAVSTTTLGFIEPAAPQDRLIIAGDMDTRAAWLYTLSDLLKQGDIVKDSVGNHWKAKGDTAFFAFTNDFKTPLIFQEIKPVGIS